MLGTRVPLAPHERGIAVRLTDVAGLAGLVSPGQIVGLMAIVTDSQSPTKDTVAKYLLSGLRVLWLSPEFRVRPANAERGETRGATDGLALLAVSTRPAPILYAHQTALFARALGLLSAAEQAAQGVTPELIQALDTAPTVIWGVPLEMVAAVAAVEGRFQTGDGAGVSRRAGRLARLFHPAPGGPCDPTAAGRGRPSGRPAR